MIGLGAVRSAVVFALLLVLHYTLRPLLGWRPAIDFLVIAVLLAAVRVRPGSAAAIGFIAGLATDSSLTIAGFGSGALAMTGIAFAASWMKAIFFADNVWLNGFFFFVGKWVFDVIMIATEQRLSAGDTITQLLLWSPLAAFNTAIAGIVLLIVLRPVLEPAGT
jgi:rod shape-determining protein MreD